MNERVSVRHYEWQHLSRDRNAQLQKRMSTFEQRQQHIRSYGSSREQRMCPIVGRIIMLEWDMGEG